jgi:hypothetical protein
MIALLTGVVVCSMALGATLTPERDPEIQDRIAAVVTAVVEEPDAIDERVQDLRLTAADRREALLVQLALFLSDSSGTEDAMTGALLVRALEFTPEEKLSAVLPHLEAEPAALRKVLAEILGTIDRPDGGMPDFEFYEQWLWQHGRETAAGLIRYMYRVSPGEAVNSMTRVFSDEGATAADSPSVAALEDLVARHDGLSAWPEGERAEADELLDRLANAPSWWVRLYVAATLQKEPDLGTSSLRSRVADDRDPLVRSVARGANPPR